MSETALIPLCLVADVSADLPVRVEQGGIAYAVFLVDDLPYVTADLCTHGPGSMSEGYVENGEVECPFHQGRFDIRTGQPTAAPCVEALRTWPARVVDGQVCIERAAA